MNATFGWIVGVVIVLGGVGAYLVFTSKSDDMMMKDAKDTSVMMDKKTDTSMMKDKSNDMMMNGSTTTDHAMGETMMDKSDPMMEGSH